MLRAGWRGLLGLALAVVTLPACSEDRPGPEAAARSLATGLASFDLSGVPLVAEDAGAAEQLAAAVEGLGERRPSVTVGGVREPAEEGRAEADLEVAWDLDGDGQVDWAYATTADLVLVEDAWQVDWAPVILEPSLQPGERLVVRRTPAERGEVLGAGGQVLVTDRPVRRVGIDKTQVAAEQAETSARALAELLETDPDGLAERVAAAGPRAFVEAIVLRDDASYPLADDALDDIPGAVALADELPLAPTREFARPLLGTVGTATAEIVEESQGRVQPGDLTGLSGLQAAYDAQLAGSPGLVVQALPTDDADADARTLFEQPPVAGQPLLTSLDLRLQQLAEDVLAPVQPASAIVALRPSTGEVLAAASGPGGEGYSTATVGRYPPGSTMKVVTALALLRAGYTPETAVPCTPTLEVDGRVFTNYDDYPASALGDVPLRTALAQSCNTAMMASRADVPPASLAQAAAALGLGAPAELGVEAFLGSVPTDAEGTEHAASLIGQGRVEASPLAMAAVAASVGAGERVVPTLLPEHQGAAPEEPAEPLTAEEAEQLRAMMRAVVTEGSASFLADVPGEVAAKTGTAEYGTDDPPRVHAWMIALRGDLAVAVFVADGESGSRTAGPLLEEFLRGAR